MSSRPTAPELARMLGRAHTSYEALTTRVGATCEWRKYTKNSPWVLRVSQGTRPLFYVKPDRGSFEVTVLLGPRATKAALGGRVAKALHPFIRSARVYAEGRPVRVVVRNKRDLEGVNQLVDVKLHPEAPLVRPAANRARRALNG